jgi:microcystin-dependent protein
MLKFFDYILNLNTIIYVIYIVCAASSNEDIEFKLPDLTVDYLTKNRNAHLEAFKTQFNNEILNNKKESDYFRLTWVSYGYPVITTTKFDSSSFSSLTEVSRNDDSAGFQFINKHKSSKSFNSSNLFHFTPEGFHIFVEMLTKEQQELFAQKVRSKYNILVKPEQIVRLIPERFSCNLEIFDNLQRKHIKLKGFSRNSREYPLRVDFFYSKFDEERMALEERIKMMQQDDGLDEFSFDCEFETMGKKSKKNILKITLDQLNDLNLLDEIFGPNNENVYLTRNQMTELSDSIYGSLKIEEIYEITEHEFRDKFISNLIELVADSSFKNVDFDSALSLLSKYSIDIQDDLKPDIIRNEMSKILVIDKRRQKSHIILNQSYAELLNKNSNSNFAFSGSGGLISKLIGNPNVSFAKQKSSEWQKQTSSLDDQLNELNKYSKNEIQWQFDGEKIVPKSIKVTLLKKAKFRKTLTFDRIYQIYNDAEFKRQFTLDVKNSISIYEKEDDEPNKKSSFQKGMIMIVDSNVLNNYFDIEGKGFNEYIGWHVCNGLSNTPDLKGKFVVGLDKNHQEYSNVGNAGGNDFVKLTVNQMPSHTHTDSGHNHYVSITTSAGGDHGHSYQDSIWDEGGGWFGFYKNGNLVRATRHLNTAWAGSHAHNVNGHTTASHAVLSETGGNQEFDNRPSYYVVAYIIYQGIN